MKICHIHYSRFPFLTTPIPYEITKNLHEIGIESHVIALSLGPGENLEEVFAGVKVTRIPISHNQRNVLSLEKFTQIAKSILLEDAYDIVHVYAFRGASYLRLRAMKTNNKWLYHLITGNITGGIKSFINNRLIKVESRKFDTIVVNTKNVGKRILGDVPTIEIPPGVDYNRFIPGINHKLRSELGYEPNDIIAVYSGSFSPYRKLDALIMGFSLTLGDCNQLKLLIVGSGEKKPLESLVSKLNIESHVKILGPFPYTSMQRFISIADIGLAYVPITPEYNPQPALKTLEMLSSGKPVIATATDGNAYFIRDGENGLLVNDLPLNIAEGLLRVVNDENLRNKISHGARLSVKEFDWRQIVKDRLVPVYRQMIGENTEIHS